MLTPNLPAAPIASCVLTLFSTHTSTSGGWSDSDANDATVIPYVFPSCSVVTTVTPLAKWDIASLNWASSIGIAGAVYPHPAFATLSRVAGEGGVRVYIF